MSKEKYVKFKDVMYRYKYSEDVMYNKTFSNKIIDSILRHYSRILPPGNDQSFGLILSVLKPMDLFNIRGIGEKGVKFIVDIFENECVLDAWLEVWKVNKEEFMSKVNN